MRRFPWVVLGAAGLWAGAWLLALAGPYAHLLPGCAFKRWTGYSCATCGATRCLMTLGRGDLAGAFHWHPVLAGVAILLPILALWDLRRAWRGEPYPDLPQSRAARVAAWGIFLAAWALQVARGI